MIGPINGGEVNIDGGLVVNGSSAALVAMQQNERTTGELGIT